MTIVNLYPIKDAEIGNSTGYVVAQDGKSTGAYMGCWDWPYEFPYTGWYGYQARLLYQFSNLPLLPAGSVIIRATLKMYITAAGKAMSDYNKAYYKENANPVINVHRITNEWDEGDGVGDRNQNWAHQYSGVNWNLRTASRYWNTYGGDIDPTPVASKQIPYTSQFVDFDVTNLFKQWQSGVYPNEGLMVKYKDDQIPQGGFYTWTKEAMASGGTWGVPYIEVEYNDPPEAPRGLQPNNLGTISPRWGPVRMDWDFIDLEMESIGGYIDLVFMLDGSGSFVDDKAAFMRQLKLYLDRLESNTPNFRLMLIDHRSQQLVKYGWYTDRGSFERQVASIQPSGGNYYTTQDVFLNQVNGAKSLSYRANAQVHLIFMTDEGLQGTYGYAEKKAVADWAISNGYTIWTIIHGCYLGGFPEFSVPTGGQNIDLHIEFNKMLPVPRASSRESDIESGDYQTRANVRIWRVEPTGVRTLLKTVTASSTTHVDLDPAAIPLVNKQVYEWDVTVFDSSGLSAVSQKAIFTYRDDDGSFDTIITWGELPKPGDIVKRSDIFQFKEELAKLVPLYPHMKPSIVGKLFTGDIVPSREDSRLLKEILSQMIEGTALKVTDVWTRDFIDDDLLDPNDIDYIRTILDILKNQGPVKPPQMTATLSSGYLSAPISLTATNGGSYSSLINLQWAPPVYSPGGFLIQTKASASRNLLFYRVHYNFRRATRIRRSNGVTTNNEMFHTFFQYTPQMFEDGGISANGTANGGEIFIAKDGATTFDEIYVRAVDTEGHYSPESYVSIRNTNEPSIGTSVDYYAVEYQIGDIDAIQSDASGVWTLIDTLVVGNSTQVNIRASGTVWFRIRGVTKLQKKTDYTYTTKPIKLLL